MAEAAEKFRREMDLMREQLKEPSAAPVRAAYCKMVFCLRIWSDKLVILPL